MRNRIIVLTLVLVAAIAGFGLLRAGHHQPAPAVTQPATQPATPGQVPAGPPPADPCSGTSATNPGTNTAGTSGFPDEGFDFGGDDQSTPTPANPVKKMCEGGKIMMIVGNDREFGHRIGDIDEIEVVLVTDPSVTIDFSSLKNGTLGFNGNQFEIAASNPVSIRSGKTKDGHVAYIIDLRLQTFVNTDPGVVFNLDLRYSTGLLPDGKTQNWQVLTTPDFFVTRSNTLDNGTDLQEGSLDAASTPSPWLMWPALVTGIFLVLLWPGVVFVRWINRIRPGRKVPKEEIAWRKFNRAIRDANEDGWDYKHYKNIASALRVYFDVAALTPLEVEDRLKDHPKIDLILSALEKCDRVLYHHASLTDAENKQLKRELDLLVPKLD